MSILKGSFLLTVAVLVLSLALTGCPTPTTEEPVAPAEDEATTTSTTEAMARTETPEAVTRVCTQCHGLQDIAGEQITPPGQGTIVPEMKGTFQTASPRGDWTSTVARMKDENQCPMTDGEQEEIVNWLNANIK